MTNPGVGPKTRKCTKCGETKIIEAFARYNKGQRIRGSCTACRLKERKQRQDAMDNRNEHAVKRAEQIRRARFLRNYGLTLEERDAMILARDGLCDICKQPETRTINGVLQPLCVDHVEGTRIVRGMLCSNCNVAIGLLQHSPQLLCKAAAYLRK